ncbi:MAG: non-canonical purine NTP pyrophosphatase [Nitrospira sp. WS110]|nr:non-canonical purine NTP pyrophosphatase [Nitrospira sp. WS110]
MNEIVLATRNPDKGRELGALLGGLRIRIRTLADFPSAPEVVEDGTTCEANAIKKAREIAQATGVPAVADDTGLEVDALGGRPGVYAARYAGEHATYEDNWRKLLLELVGVPGSKRTARFLTVAAIAFPSGDVHVTQGSLEGLIAEQPLGDRGFGYDPVFLVPEFNRTLAQLTAEEKNRMSHRARAFVQMRLWLVDHCER